MINPNNSSYIREREEFHSDKCGHCMSYVNDDGDCTDQFCSSLIPCETDYNSLQVGDSFVSLRGLVAVVKGICDKSALHKFLDVETLYNVSVDGRERVLTPLGIQNFINYR